MPLRLLAAVLLTGCSSDHGDHGWGFIAPLDGQTLVPEDLSLRVVPGGATVPEDAALHPDLVQVFDVDGRRVPGVLERRDGLRFTPDAPWRSGHTYLWTVGEVPGAARQPEQALPEAILGSATFTVSEGAAVLAAGIAETGEVCLVLSRPVAEMPPLELTVMDEPVGGTWEIREEPGRSVGDLLPGDPGISLTCWIDAPELLGGEGLRVWWGDEGPWHFVLDHAEPEELTAALRREQP